MPPSLTFVGTGISAGAQLTPQARDRLETADRVFFLGLDRMARQALETLRPRARSLADCFAEEMSRSTSYRRVVERLMAEVRSGAKVCVALYGHPGVFVSLSHEAIRQARVEGFEATMLPAVSAEDCLFADLGVDPASHGCRSFEATDFLLRPRPVDTSTALVLWQIGAIGVTVSKKEALWSRRGLEILASSLAAQYPVEHRGTIYQAAMAPDLEPTITEVLLRNLAEAPVTIASTLYVPPVRRASVDRGMASQLGLTLDLETADPETTR